MAKKTPKPCKPLCRSQYTIKRLSKTQLLVRCNSCGYFQVITR